MKMTIEVDCSAQEARAFLGLPDVTALNEKLVEEMQSRMTSNMAMLSPDELMKNWTAFGVGAQEQFRKLMSAAVDAGMGNTRPK
ncbi:MAG: DUF6489 family protein [Phenylobacterium sp.]|uniref:DUF6489 family protein n=1 Tax=unclassified Phenylobacterium TaxID=2640670 RepID=UPI0020C97470|nr:MULTISPECIES: DUF6489 family protein [unclassified Phenylobacterium]MDP3746023.1 DUF6489 family protein [Phenylobacterium sp.]UTP39658.1 DUF6489 family protein [Phenylobacterium sp. LH3H17]